MASRTFNPLTGSGANDSIIVAHKFGYQDAEDIRQALDMALYLAGHLDLGGDERAILSASYVPVNGSRTFTLDGDKDGGLDIEAVLFYYTSNAATTVTARVRNVTDSTTAGTSATSAATAVVTEALALTLASGNKVYQLQVTGSDAVYPVYCWGYLRIHKVPA